MAKRANPFLEDFVQQRKIHVGLKQFNNNKERLQDVYDKTMQLLFDGANKPIIHVVPSGNNASLVTPKLDRKLKQLSIGKNGALLHDTIVEHGLQQQQPCAEQCECTLLRLERSEPESRCAYCEGAVCAASGGQCVRCGEQHCHRCSLHGPDGDRVCVSCYG